MAAARGCLRECETAVAMSPDALSGSARRLAGATWPTLTLQLPRPLSRQSRSDIRLARKLPAS